MNPATQQPKIVAIELTNHCNLSCKHCPQSTSDVERGFMDESTFLAAIQRCSGYTELNWRGEPLLHPKLLDYVSLAKTHNRSLNLGFHTNTHLLSKEIFHDLVVAGLDWMHVSLHTPESCKNYRDIQRWNNAAKKKIYVYADVDTTEEELTALVTGIRRDEYVKYHVANWAGHLTNYRVIHEDPCDALLECEYVNKNMVVVTWKGNVNACCWDFEEKHCIGHINEFDKVCHHPPYTLCRCCLWSHEPLPGGVDLGSYEGYTLIQKENRYYALLADPDAPRALSADTLEALKVYIKIDRIQRLKMSYSFLTC